MNWHWNDKKKQARHTVLTAVLWPFPGPVEATSPCSKETQPPVLILLGSSLHLYLLCTTEPYCISLASSPLRRRVLLRAQDACGVLWLSELWRVSCFVIQWTPCHCGSGECVIEHSRGKYSCNEFTFKLPETLGWNRDWTQMFLANGIRLHILNSPWECKRHKSRDFHLSLPRTPSRVRQAEITSFLLLFLSYVTFVLLLLSFCLFVGLNMWLSQHTSSFSFLCWWSSQLYLARPCFLLLEATLLNSHQSFGTRQLPDSFTSPAQTFPFSFLLEQWASTK